MYKEIFLVAFLASCMYTASVDSTPIVCDELLRIFDDKSSKRGTLGRIRNAINRACTALDLLRHGINPLDLLTASDDVTKKTRRPGPTKKTNLETTTTTTTAAPTTTASTTTPAPKTTLPPADPPAVASSHNSDTLSPLEVILRNPQVNIILTNHSDLSLPRPNSLDSREKEMDVRVAVDAPRHLLPLDFNPHDLKRPYPAVYEVRTKFGCEQQPHNPGVYADMSLGCKVFHLCASTDPYHNRTSFYCPETLLFNQEQLRCDYAKNVNCHESYKVFANNENFNKKFDIKYVVLGKVN